MKETWKDIPNYEGYYQASNLGRIKSFPKKIGKGKGFFTKEVILKPLNNKDYYEVWLYKKKKIKRHKIHRLVLLTFIGESDLPCNHKNGIKTDNRLENLEYCTNLENEKHAWKNGLKNFKGEKHPNHKLKKEDVYFIKKNKNIFSQKELAEKFNVSQGTISHILLDKIWKEVTI